jgi:Zinc-binding
MVERARFVAHYTPSPQDKIQALQVRRCGSPWTPRDLAAPNTSIQARCPTCSAAFITTAARSADDNLREHIDTKHARIPLGHPPSPESIAAIARVHDHILSQIDASELKPGETIVMGRLPGDLGVTKYHIRRAVDQLLADGVLAYTEAATKYARRVLVAA